MTDFATWAWTLNVGACMFTMLICIDSAINGLRVSMYLNALAAAVNASVAASHFVA